MQLTPSRFRTNQKRYGHRTRSDWPLFCGISGVVSRFTSKMQPEISSRNRFPLNCPPCRDRREKNVGPRTICDRFLAYQLGQLIQYTLRNTINLIIKNIYCSKFKVFQSPIDTKICAINTGKQNRKYSSF